MKIAGKVILYNSKEFNEIFDRLLVHMFMLASRILKNDERGKDIAQEAFVKLFQKDTEDFESEKALQTYLYVLVKNACISELRKDKKVQNSPLEDGLSVSQQAFLNEILREETYKLLHKAIAGLSPKAEQVVRLTLEGYSNDDIANELGVTINTVKTVKRRAYKNLRELLGDQYITILFTNFIQFF